MKKKSLPTSTISRSAVIAKAGFSMALTGALNRINEVRQAEQMRIFTEALSRLKGSAMKFGQLLSIEAQDILPPQAIEALTKLQKNAAPLDSKVLFSVIHSELGSEKSLALHLETEAIASASIGQVYRGHLNPEGKIAVKVQIPNIGKSIQSDMRIIRSVATIGAMAFGKKIDFSELVNEIETVLVNETDYTKELSLLNKYTKMLAGDERFAVPRALPDYSTGKVLTMTFEEGIDLREWIHSKPSYEHRHYVGTSILDLFIIEFFQNGFVQTDPNLANFLIRPKNLQIVLLDFGAVLSYPLTFIEDYRSLIRILLTSTENEIISYCEEKAFLHRSESQEVKRQFVHMVRTSIEPFFDHLQPFDFSDKDYASKVRSSVLTFSRNAKFSKPPKELIFLHRKLGGIFQMLKMMELKLNLAPYWAKAMHL